MFGRSETSWRPDLVHMDVVVVRGVVDGLKEPLELTGGPTVHDQNEGDAHRRRMRGVSRVLVPLDIHISLTWMWEKKH